MFCAGVQLSSGGILARADRFLNTPVAQRCKLFLAQNHHCFFIIFKKKKKIYPAAELA